MPLPPTYVLQHPSSAISLHAFTSTLPGPFDSASALAVRFAYLLPVTTSPSTVAAFAAYEYNVSKEPCRPCDSYNSRERWTVAAIEVGEHVFVFAFGPSSELTQADKEVCNSTISARMESLSKESRQRRQEQLKLKDDSSMRRREAVG